MRVVDTDQQGRPQRQVGQDGVGRVAQRTSGAQLGWSAGAWAWSSMRRCVSTPSRPASVRIPTGLSIVRNVVAAVVVAMAALASEASR